MKQNLTLPEMRGKNILFKLNRVYFIAFIIALTTFLVYLPALQNGFVNWDDDVYIYKNSNIRSLDFRFIEWASSAVVSANWHPLTVLSYAVDYAFWGLNPIGYHLTNIVLHAINTFLVFILSYKLISHGKLPAIFVPAIIALLFGLHPLHVESVAWVSERKDVLCAVFFLLTFISYIRYISGVSKRRLFYGISLIFFILSLASKPMAVSLPFVLLIIDYYPFNRLKTYGAKRLFIEKVPFLLLSFASSIITIWAQSTEGAIRTLERIPLLERIVVAGRAYVFYLEKMFLPLELAPLYPYPTKGVFSSPVYVVYLAIFLIITVAAIRSFKKNSLFLAVWLYYTITLLPVIGIVQVGGQAAADRYTYIPSLGPFFVGGILIGNLYQRASMKLHIPIVAVLLLFLGIFINMTINQIGIWRDPITLWSHEIKIFPENAPVAYNSRGIVYSDLKNYNQALSDFNKAIEINPQYQNAYNNRGIVYQSIHNYTQAINDFNKVIELNPTHSIAYRNRGVAYNSLGRYTQALNDLNIAIELNPQYANAYHSRGYAYNNLGMYGQALNDLNIAIELNPQDPKARHTRGITYANSGNLQNAIIDLQKAIELDDKYAYAYSNLGLVYQRLGDSEKAISYFKKAAELNQK